MVVTVLILDVECSDSVEEKLNNKHGLTVDDVIAALNHPDRTAHWFDHPINGRQLIAKAKTPSGLQIKIVLYPVNEDVGAFRLATAFR